MQHEVRHTIQALVYAGNHANLDSLPLRYGFYFQTDSLLQLKIKSAGQPSSKPGRTVYFVEFENPETLQLCTGYAVLTDHKEKGHPVLVSIWSGDTQTEHYLSHVIMCLRKAGEFDSEWLKNKHPLYVNGSLRTHAHLVQHLTADHVITSVQEIKNQTEEVIAKVNAEQKAAQEHIAKLQQEVSDSKAERNQYMRLIEQQNIERASATSRGSRVAIDDGLTLTSVEKNVLHRGSSCTILTLSDGSKRYMKTSTFDKDGLVTSQAEELIGKQVRITHWDPVNEPGKWSSQGYFRGIYPD